MYAPAVAPFAQTCAVEGMRARHGDQSCDGRVHAFQTYRTRRELVYV